MDSLVSHMHSACRYGWWLAPSHRPRSTRPAIRTASTRLRARLRAGSMIGQLHPQAHMIEFVQAIREELRELRSENIADFAATAVLRRLLLDLDPVMAATSRSRSRFNLANRSSFKCASIACAGANGLVIVASRVRCRFTSRKLPAVR